MCHKMFCSVYVDINHNDITQDVMDMKAMLLKLQAVLNNNFNDGGEKTDASEKSILDENNELKRQVISLQKHLEEKDEKIKRLEKQLQTQIQNLSLSTVTTQT